MKYQHIYHLALHIFRILQFNHEDELIYYYQFT